MLSMLIIFLIECLNKKNFPHLQELKKKKRKKKEKHKQKVHNYKISEK